MYPASTNTTLPVRDLFINILSSGELLTGAQKNSNHLFSREIVIYSEFLDVIAPAPFEDSTTERLLKYGSVPRTAVAVPLPPAHAASRSSLASTPSGKFWYAS